ncbi:hypothetical protein K466DRAFT_507641, partial [Polyporus arcularius HHB13444]
MDFDDDSGYLSNSADYSRTPVPDRDVSPHVRSTPEPDEPSTPSRNRSASGSPPPSADQSIDDSRLPEQSALIDLTSDSPSFAPAFDEHPCIRLAYMHAVIDHVFKHAPVLTAEDRLKDELTLLRMSLPGGLPELPRKPAVCLRTATWRLGLNIDDFIELRPICDVCFKTYSHDDIESLVSPRCTVPRCKGVIYEEAAGKRTAAGPDGEHRLKREPKKQVPYSPILKILPRFLLRQDFVSALDTSTNDEDRVNDGYMYDIQDAKAYRATKLDHKQVYSPDGTVSDVKAFAGPMHTLRSVKFGLSLTINLDWFGVTENRPHSVGAIYISFNNLDRSVRYLQRNVHLITVIPGPTEPSLEQLNHILEPIVVEMKTLYAGVSVTVKGLRLPQELHAGLECHTSDVPASSKLKGTASHSHKTHLCGCCYITQEELDTLAAYDIHNFKLRDDWEMLSASFKAKECTSKAARKRVLDSTGKRYSIFDELPGWLPVKSSAYDFMHNFYGLSAHMFKEILIAGYLLDADDWRKLQDVVNSIQ